MPARVRSWVGGWGYMLWAVSANAQAPAAQFPPEPAVATTAAAPSAATAPPATPTAPPTAAAAPASRPTAVSPVPAAPARPKAPRNWNIGAGIAASGEGFNTFFTRGLPGYRAALERRVGNRTWLAINAQVGYDSVESLEASTSANPNPTETVTVNQTNTSVLLGARHVFVEGVVDVSGYSAVLAGYHTVSGDTLAASGAFALLGGDGYDLGLLLGVAVERELIDALALRLAVDLASAKLSSEEASNRGSAGETQKTPLGRARAALNVLPSLQLHFYF